MSRPEYYTQRFGNGRVRKPREENRMVDMDRLRIMARLCSRGGSWTVISLRNYVSEQNGLRPHDWDFYYVLRQMQEDAFLTVVYDPEFKANMVKATEYGRQQFNRVIEQVAELNNNGKDERARPKSSA